MAEGVAFQTSNLGTKYFCHDCSTEISPYHSIRNSQQLMCPECSSEFVEELSSDLYNSRIPDTIGFLEDDEISAITEPFFENSDLLNLDDANLPYIIESDSEVDVNEDADEPNSIDLDPYANIFGGSFRFSEDEDAMFRLRYLDEFYSGDADVDALASQLLDEVEISGPPPLSKEQIKALPIVTFATEKELNDLQCTVCMDDFQVGNRVKRLTCDHMFHEKCIIPWLERQASCPNCRSTVKVECKSKRSLSCPRTLNLRTRNPNTSNRRYSEVSNLGDFFTASMNPFRFL